MVASLESVINEFLKSPIDLSVWISTSRLLGLYIILLSEALNSTSAFSKEASCVKVIGSVVSSEKTFLFALSLK